MTYKKPELLIPASSLEVLKTAVMFGADAVYIGGEAFGLRAKAKNFSSEEMAEGVAFAHAHGVKVYVTANILAHNYDLDGARKYFAELRDMKPEQPDALIISDPGMFMIAKEVWPQVEVHISTQANNTNYETYLFWWKLGAKRVVSARELSLVEIKGIREKIPAEMEIESFVHGAMCISYSGRCLLSNFFTGRDANRGACTHPCRWKYAVVEETRPGEYRMKTALYVATVARTYRKAIDDYFTDPKLYEKNMDWYQAEISKCTYRQFTTGFYFGKPDENTQIYDNNTYVNEYIYLGIVEAVKDNLCRIEQRNKFCVGDTIEIMKPDGTNVPVTVEAMYTEDGESVDSAPHPKQVLWIKLSEAAEKYDLLRCKSV